VLNNFSISGYTDLMREKSKKEKSRSIERLFVVAKKHLSIASFEY